MKTSIFQTVNQQCIKNLTERINTLIIRGAIKQAIFELQKNKKNEEIIKKMNTNNEYFKNIMINITHVIEELRKCDTNEKIMIQIICNIIINIMTDFIHIWNDDIDDDNFNIRYLSEIAKAENKMANKKNKTYSFTKLYNNSCLLIRKDNEILTGFYWNMNNKKNKIKMNEFTKGYTFNVESLRE